MSCRSFALPALLGAWLTSACSFGAFQTAHTQAPATMSVTPVASNMPMSWAATGVLPPGTVFNTKTGNLSGKFTKNGAYVVKLTATKLGDSGLVLVRPDDTRHVVRERSQSVELRGEPSEIALYLAGRRDAADVEIHGDASAITNLKNANLGI